MSITRLIESLGMSGPEMRRYLVAEVDEFLEADDPQAKEEEFGDVLFSLMSLGWAHGQRHYQLDPSTFEAKVRRRLRTHAAITRYPRRYLHDSIPDLRFGVLHVAFGQFTGQWKAFEPLKNGTVAEIVMLTDAPIDRAGTQANHCILTFDDTASLEYELIHASSDRDSGNTVLCRIPNFLYQRTKSELAFGESGHYLSLQVLAALDGIRLSEDAVVHFHSWEGGFLADSEEFRRLVDGHRTLFSPYLTIGPLKSFVDASGGKNWTMTERELHVASCYEEKLCRLSQQLILESDRDRQWYASRGLPCDLEVRSFSARSQASFSTEPNDDRRLTFVAGGRPVREKGFVELCRQFAAVRAWAERKGLDASLAILCREPRHDKGAAYIEEIETAIAALGLQHCVRVEPKTSVEKLRQRIAASTALIVPSLHDPFCLMPSYAMDVERPSFVSARSGVSENICSRDFVFDPLAWGDLVRAVQHWYDQRPAFVYEAKFPRFDTLYVKEEGR